MNTLKEHIDYLISNCDGIPDKPLQSILHALLGDGEFRIHTTYNRMVKHNGKIVSWISALKAKKGELEIVQF
jgi:hypothetical protein